MSETTFPLFGQHFEDIAKIIKTLNALDDEIGEEFGVVIESPIRVTGTEGDLLGWVECHDAGMWAFTQTNPKGDDGAER